MKILKFGYDFTQPIGDSLYELIDLQELYFKGVFNQPLERTLILLWNLKILKIGVYWDPKHDTEKQEKDYSGRCFYNGGQTLSFDSFNSCTSLKTITFPHNFELSESLLNDFENHGINIDFYFCNW